MDTLNIHSDQSNYMEENQPNFGGYENEFVDEVLRNHKCPLCLYPMRDVVQISECGHRFCKVCLVRVMLSDHPGCPIDRREIQGYFSDEAWAREILCLRVKCKQTKKGCDWIGQLRHAEDHDKNCSTYEREECIGCGEIIQTRLLEAHHNNQCPKRIITCVHCQDEFYFIQTQQHEDSYCRRYPLECTNSCGRVGIPREEMDKHLLEKCPMTEVTCPYAKAGCLFQDKRAYLNEHMEASVEDHWKLQFEQMQEKIQKLTETVADYGKENRDLSLKVENLENLYGARRMAKEKRKAQNKVEAFRAS